MDSQESRNLETRLRAAVDSAPSGLLMVDASGTIVLVNRETERLFGYAREELLGRPVEVLVPERFRAGHPEFRAGFMDDPKVRVMGAGRELFGLRKDGTEVPVEIGLTPVATEEGMFVISSVVDISARRKAEERFRAAVESSPNGMVMVSREGRIVLVNREAERLFGYTRQELMGRSIETLVPERFRTTHPDLRAGYFDDPSTRAMGAGRELFGLRKDGTEVPVEIGLNPIDTDDELLVLASIVDISARLQAQEERRQLETQLRQAQKMEAVGTLAGGIAHDFNNILGAIVGYAELARGELEGSPDAARADLGEVLTAAARGKDLVERILRLSRRQEPERRPMDLGGTVREVASLLRATIPAGIEMELHVEATAPRVLADATAVQQILMNLATNAAQAMTTGGLLEIGLEPVYVRDSVARSHSDLREGPYVLLSVGDTGEGIDPTIRERVFEPFFTTKPAGSGSGLGLAIVHGIVRDHDGAVEMESEPGRGTVVHCFFPALDVDVEPDLPRQSELALGGGERVLYVDDEPALVTVGERRLQKVGYRVSVATDPLKALERVRAAPQDFDLVITDYSMPALNGIELAHEITRVRRDLPVLLLTGFLHDLGPEELRAAGVHRVLRKPVTSEELAAAVGEALRAGRHRS